MLGHKSRSSNAPAAPPGQLSCEAELNAEKPSCSLRVSENLLWLLHKCWWEGMGSDPACFSETDLCQHCVRSAMALPACPSPEPCEKGSSPTSLGNVPGAARSPVLFKPIPQRQEGAMSALAMPQHGGCSDTGDNSPILASC